MLFLNFVYMFVINIRVARIIVKTHLITRYNLQIQHTQEC